MKQFGGIAVGMDLGNFGFKIKGVTPQQVFAEPEFFHKIFTRNKVVGFMEMNPTNMEHAQVVDCLFRGDHDPLFNGGLLADQTHSSIPDVEGKKLTVEEFVRSQWHVDNCFHQEVPSMTSMHMTTYTVQNPLAGHTYFASLINMYHECPDHLKEHLKTARFKGGTGAESYKVVSHPALRTHPVTGETAIFWTGEGTLLEGGETAWFEELREWIRNYLSNETNLFIWRWTQGDVLVWDNRVLLHAFGNGWDRSERIFQRVELGSEVPFYEPERDPGGVLTWGDLQHEGASYPSTRGPNPDHIPLVFTKGISALEGCDHLFQKVAVCVVGDGSIPQNLQDALDRLNNDRDISLLAIEHVDPNIDSPLGRALKRYTRSSLDQDLEPGQVLLFGRNGDLHGCFAAGADLLPRGETDPRKLSFVDRVEPLLVWHPDMRHAGHAWHYPDWFPHQPLKYRPWSYHHLAFNDYMELHGEPPSEDFLVQFVIDNVYGAFNHLTSDEDRFRIIWRIKDYLDYMLELGEHKNDR